MEKKQHEMFLHQMLVFSVCMVTMRKPFARSTALVCTDSWHGFPHGFFAQIFVRMLAGNFCTDLGTSI